MTDKRHKIPWLIIILGILAALHLPIFIFAFLAFSNPPAYNYRRDYLDESEWGNYLQESEYHIAIIFAIILFAFLLFFLLSVILRKRSTRILPVMVGGVVIFAFFLTRVIWCFTQGGIHIVVGVINVIAVIGVALSLYFFFRRHLDGDNRTGYYVALIIALAGMIFGSMTQHSYSVLNALGHQGDVVYWSSYGITRLMILTYAVLAFVNHKTDYDPLPIAEVR